MSPRAPTAVVLLASVWMASCSPEAAPTAPPAPAERTDVEILRDRVEKDPRDADAWFRLAVLYERATQYQDEVDALLRVVDLRPEMGWARFKLGTTYGRLGCHAEAVKQLTAAAKRIESPVLYNNLAVSYGMLGKTGEEVKALQKAISLRPRYAAAHYNLGMAFLRRGERSRAKREHAILLDLDEGTAAFLKKAIEAGPTDRRQAMNGAR